MNGFSRKVTAPLLALLILLSPVLPAVPAQNPHHLKSVRISIKANQAWVRLRFDEAARLYAQAISEEEASGNPRKHVLKIYYGFRAASLYYTRNPFTALRAYRTYLKKFSDICTKPEILKNHLNAADLARRLGQFKISAEHLSRARKLAGTIGKPLYLGRTLLQSGSLDFDLGRTTQALSKFSSSWKILRIHGSSLDQLRLLSRLGIMYLKKNRNTAADKIFTLVTSLAYRTPGSNELIELLSGIGELYLRKGNIPKALFHFNNALYAYNANPFRSRFDRIFLESNIAKTHYARGKYKLAASCFKKALEISTGLSAGKESARLHLHIGDCYFRTGDLTEAVKHYLKAVTILNNLRLSAKGTDRMDFMQAQRLPFQNLTRCYLQMGDIHRAFAALESFRSRTLAESMGIKQTDAPTRKTLLDLQHNLAADETAVFFGTVKDNRLAAFIISRRDIRHLLVPIDAFLRSCRPYIENISKIFTQSMKADRIDLQNFFDNKDSSARLFHYIVSVYRLLLSTPPKDGKNLRLRTFIAGQIGMLFGIMEKKFPRGTTRLLLSPSGMLTQIPFGTILQGDKYLAQKYIFRYIHSARVYNRLCSLKKKADRKMLAVGGAVYDVISYDLDMAGVNLLLEDLKNKPLLLASRGRNMRDIYARMGTVSWSNLPGTLGEIRAIRALLPGGKLLSGVNASEEKIKAMSKDGSLSRYRYLHFATHGLAVPLQPELSALVLCQTPGLTTEDGYLRLPEIARLKLNADLVTLSACETGLGKIYEGEGTFGLTQAFLAAGARAAMVSLWQVSDDSTMRFMVGTYRKVIQGKMHFPDAVREIQTAFIQGKFGMKYKDPYYWAPFVYYGR